METNGSHEFISRHTLILLVRRFIGENEIQFVLIENKSTVFTRRNTRFVFPAKSSMVRAMKED